MPDVPFTVFLGPILVVVVLIALPIYRKAYMSRTDRKYVDFRVGNIAHRLGLQIIEGDPELNMIQAYTAHRFQRANPVGGFMAGFRGATEKQTRVQLRGTVRGHPVEFLFDVQTETVDDLIEVESTESFACELAVAVPAGVPAFEVLLRSQSKHWGARPTLGLPAQSLGQQELDATLAFLCGDPALGRWLAPVLAGLRHHNFVHLRCVHGRLSALATRVSVGMVVDKLAETQAVLVEIADMLSRSGQSPNNIGPSTPAPSRLYQLARTPREQIEAIGYRPLGLLWRTRRSWEEAMRDGPLVLTSVVQANEALFDASTAQPAPAVILYTDDPARRLDGAFLRAVTERVWAVRDAQRLADGEYTRVQGLLRNQRSTFKVTLPREMSFGVPVVMQTVTLMPEALPAGHIPPDRLVPSILGREGDLFDVKPSAYL
jgi:hypothetical protein